MVVCHTLTIRVYHTYTTRTPFACLSCTCMYSCIWLHTHTAGAVCQNRWSFFVHAHDFIINSMRGISMHACIVLCNVLACTQARARTRTHTHCTHANTHTYKNTQTHTHTHTHTHTQVVVQIAQAQGLRLVVAPTGVWDMFSFHMLILHMILHVILEYILTTVLSCHD